jgi:hypothetical protein
MSESVVYASLSGLMLAILIPILCMSVLNGSIYIYICTRVNMYHLTAERPKRNISN